MTHPVFRLLLLWLSSSLIGEVLILFVEEEEFNLMIPRFLLMTTGGGFNLGFDDDDGILADVTRPPFAVSFL